MIQTQLLTPAEENLMLTCWKLEQFYFRELLELLPEPKPHQNTVSTYLKILVEKGFVTPTREGRIFRYTVSTPIEDYKKTLIKDLVSKYFNGSGKDLLKFLLTTNLISKEDLSAFFNLKIELVGMSDQPRHFVIADEVLKPKKTPKKKDKDKKKKHK